MPAESASAQPEKLTRDSKLSNWTGILPLSSIFTAGLIALLIYWFFAGHIYRFYASVLFLFYALVKKMWVSVIMLGIFQTLLMVPFRIIRVLRSQNIKEFQKQVNAYKTEDLQLKKIKTDFHFGNRLFLFYILDFVVQLTTFLTIGRLFLTDFYRYKLDPGALYSWIPYPEYPIQDTFFKLPYPQVTATINLGWKMVLIVWVAILIIKLVSKIIQATIRKNQGKKEAEVEVKYQGSNAKYSVVYMLLILGIAWYVTSHFPVAMQLGIFSGDVSQPNQTFNTVTALATFLTLLWFGSQKIIRKSRLAQEQGVDPKVISQTQKRMFPQTVFDATVVGLGAFFITNQIPSAFELSIFTLEVISLLSPLTLDKLIVKNTKPQMVPLTG